MLDRAVRLACGGVLFVALGGVASAAIPDAGAQPSDKPALNHASPMINDPVGGTSIRGKAPANTKIISVPNYDIQAHLPDPSKPVLYRASPMIDDPLIHGTAPTGTNMAPHDDVQAEAPDTSKPPLYRASPMINDPATTIHGAPPSKASP